MHKSNCSTIRVQAYTDALKLTQNRFTGGAAPKSDVAQAQTQLDGAQVQDTDVTVMRAQYEHAIATLIGKPPAELSIAFSPQTPMQLPAIPVGLPATLLERRPDIAAGERHHDRRRSERSNRIARAAFFPSLGRFGATGGFEATSISNWSILAQPCGSGRATDVADDLRRRTPPFCLRVGDRKIMT